MQFRTGETAVRDNDRARIAKLGALVAGLEDVRVRVSGFADSRGDDALNQTLSQERAEMVALELEKAGVPKERMIIEAMGERFASSEAQPDDQAFERCVEIRFESAHFARQQLSRSDAGAGEARSSGSCRSTRPTLPSLAPTMNAFRSSISEARSKARVGTPAADRLLAGNPRQHRRQLLQRRHPAVLRRHAGRARAASGASAIRSPSSAASLAAGWRSKTRRGERWEFGAGRGLRGAGGLRRNLGSHRRLHQVLRDLRGAHLNSASALAFDGIIRATRTCCVFCATRKSLKYKR